MKSSSARFKKELAVLKSRYCLVSKAANSADAITLSRVCMTFPHISCSYMVFCGHTIVDYSVMEDYVEGYPKQLMTAAFASIIPPSSHEFHATFLDAHLLHQYEFSKVISPKDNSKSAKELYPDLLKYAMAAVNGSIISPDAREALLMIWGLMDHERVPSTVIVTAADIFNII